MHLKIFKIHLDERVWMSVGLGNKVWMSLKIVQGIYAW